MSELFHSFVMALFSRGGGLRLMCPIGGTRTTHPSLRITGNGYTHVKTGLAQTSHTKLCR